MAVVITTIVDTEGKFEDLLASRRTSLGMAMHSLTLLAQYLLLFTMTAIFPEDVTQPAFRVD